jgi:hypothetical protein
MGPTFGVMSSTVQEFAGHFPFYLRQVLTKLFRGAERVIVSGHK